MCLKLWGVWHYLPKSIKPNTNIFARSNVCTNRILALLITIFLIFRPMSNIFSLFSLFIYTAKHQSISSLRSREPFRNDICGCICLRDLSSNPKHSSKELALKSNFQRP